MGTEDQTVILRLLCASATQSSMSRTGAAVTGTVQPSWRFIEKVPCPQCGVRPGALPVTQGHRDGPAWQTPDPCRREGVWIPGGTSSRRERRHRQRAAGHPARILAHLVRCRAGRGHRPTGSSTTGSAKGLRPAVVRRPRRQGARRIWPSGSGDSRAHGPPARSGTPLDLVCGVRRDHWPSGELASGITVTVNG